ncbi:hypothetical protein [Companilactobacillus zhongbaensis]|uniref:hypothetical protein n=1 Tax=Companilactobacillus zhongbaensis TaxID=2486009 RepID=UPI000F774DC9|nr:hypothetical protein [Companilactobacillus zhongbaensis]
MKKNTFIGSIASVLFVLSSSAMSGTVLAANDYQSYFDDGGVTITDSDVGADSIMDIPNNDPRNWHFTEIKGIVTADHDAPLYDDNGTKIPDRTVSAKSSWAVDGSKKNDFTNEQRFRISAHEWISENDAGFHETHTLSKVKRTPFVNIKVDTDGRTTVHLKPGKNYDLYKSDGTLSNRKLAGGTDWFSDESAEEPGELVDNQYPTQYLRVSTDEWVLWNPSNGVDMEFAPFL